MKTPHDPTLFTRIGIPGSVGEIGVAETDLDSLSELSMGAARLVENNPARLDAAAVKTVLTRALQGARG